MQHERSGMKSYALKRVLYISTELQFSSLHIVLTSSISLCLLSFSLVSTQFKTQYCLFYFRSKTCAIGYTQHVSVEMNYFFSAK